MEPVTANANGLEALDAPLKQPSVESLPRENANDHIEGPVPPEIGSDIDPSVLSALPLVLPPIVNFQPPIMPIPSSNGQDPFAPGAPVAPVVPMAAQSTVPGSPEQTLAGVTELIKEPQTNTSSVPSTLLRANEIMLSDDESEIEDEMDTQSEQDFSNEPSAGPNSCAMSPLKPSHSISPSSSLSSNSSSLHGLGVGSAAFSTLTLPDNVLPAPLDMSSVNFPKSRRHSHRAALYAMHPYHRATNRSGAGVNVAKTLDLMKAVLQNSFNKDLASLCQSYLQIYQVAAANINDNTGDHIPEATLKTLVCRMMEEAQQAYQNGRWDFPSVQLPKNDKVTMSKGSPMSTKKPRMEREPSKYGTGSKRGRKPTEKVADNVRSAWRWSLDKRRLDPVKWSPDKLNGETQFVLGVNVNKALGHAANRGKVYLLHPELFKYVGDGDDKTWLYENKHLPVHGGKAFLMIFDEVEELVKVDECYKDNPEILRAVQKLPHFSCPPFVLEKMKEFIRNVQGYFAQEGNSTTS